jgi:hypothetical protein
MSTPTEVSSARAARIATKRSSFRDLSCCSTSQRAVAGNASSVDKFSSMLRCTVVRSYF